MPRPIIRLLISVILVIHFAIIGAALLAHRGASYLHDDFLSMVSVYTALGNWRVDANRIPIASNNMLDEIVRVEYHHRDNPDEIWDAFVPATDANPAFRRATLTRRERLEQYWIHQLSGLIFYDNDEGVGRMLMAGLRSDQNQELKNIDKIRVTVAPRLSLEQYLEVALDDDPSKLPDAYRPQVAYLASIINLGNEQYSLLRQLEASRASKVVVPSNHFPKDEGRRP